MSESEGRQEETNPPDIQVGDDNDAEEENGEEEEDDDDEDEDPLARLPPQVVPRVLKLNELNEQRDKIMQDYLAERAALEQKYFKMKLLPFVCWG